MCTISARDVDLWGCGVWQDSGCGGGCTGRLGRSGGARSTSTTSDSDETEANRSSLPTSADSLMSRSASSSVITVQPVDLCGRGITTAHGMLSRLTNDVAVFSATMEDWRDMAKQLGKNRACLSEAPIASQIIGPSELEDTSYSMRLTMSSCRISNRKDAQKVETGKSESCVNSRDTHCSISPRESLRLTV